MAQQVHCIIFWTGCKIFILSPYNHSSRRKSIKSICWGMLKGVHLKKKKKRARGPISKGHSAIIQPSTSPALILPFSIPDRSLIHLSVDPYHHAAIHLNMIPTSPSEVIVGYVYLNMCWNEVFKHVLSRQRSS